MCVYLCVCVCVVTGREACQVNLQTQRTVLHYCSADWLSSHRTATDLEKPSQVKATILLIELAGSGEGCVFVT